MKLISIPNFWKLLFPIILSLGMGLFISSRPAYAGWAENIQSIMTPQFLSQVWQSDEPITVGEAVGRPAAVPVYDSEGETIGYIFSTLQTGRYSGYSGTPFDIVAGVSTEGEVMGIAALIAHFEPIIDKGTPLSLLIRYLNQLDTVHTWNTYKTELPPDIVKGATISSTLMRDGLINSARKILRTRDVKPYFGPPILDMDAFETYTWIELEEMGAITRLYITNGDVENAFLHGGYKDAVLAEPLGPRDEIFLELYMALGTPPIIGQNIAPREYERYFADTGGQFLILAGRGEYDYKGTQYRYAAYNKLFDRIRILQSGKIIYLEGADYIRRSVFARVEDPPEMTEEKILEVDESDDGIRLDVFLRREVSGITDGIITSLVQTRQIQVNGDRASESTLLKAGQIVLVPPIAIKEEAEAAAAEAAEAAEAEAEAAADAGPAPPAAGIAPVITREAELNREIYKLPEGPKTLLRQSGIFGISDSDFDPTLPFTLQLLVKASADGGPLTIPFAMQYQTPESFIRRAEDDSVAAAQQDGEVTLPLWMQVWVDQRGDVGILSLALIVLTVMLWKQDSITRHRKMYRVVRLSFLAFTFGWLGWYANAQLSVINLLVYLQAPFADLEWTFYLTEPLIVMVAVYTLVSLFIWGRSLFCGWLCPFGALQEILTRIAEFLRIPQVKLKHSTHHKLWWIKYVIWLGLIPVAFLSRELMVTSVEVEPFKTAITAHFQREWPFVAYAVGILAIGLFMERAYCRFVCPLGAGLAILGRFNAVRFLRRRTECGTPKEADKGGCHLCEHSCVYRAIGPDGKIIEHECFYCLDCQAEYHDDHRCPPLAQARKHGERLLEEGRKDITIGGTPLPEPAE